jgi:hypothetical protein
MIELTKDEILLILELIEERACKNNLKTVELLKKGDKSKSAYLQEVMLQGSSMKYLSRKLDSYLTRV